MLVSVCAGLVCAQTSVNPASASSSNSIERLRELVEAGALPRVQLEKAEAAAADAEDEAFLRKTLYGKDLTEQQADEMIAVTERRVDRKQEALDKRKALVDEGVASRSELTPLLEDLDMARKEHDLALSRAKLVEELAEMAKAEVKLQAHLENAPWEAHKIAERYDGDGMFTPHDFQRVEVAFHQEFSKDLPISASGETAVHRALGFDHRNRVDVAINPDQPEGVWLRQFLAANHIPYFAFRAAVPRKATGAHIHIGPQSTRLVHGG